MPKPWPNASHRNSTDRAISLRALSRSVATKFDGASHKYGCFTLVTVLEYETLSLIANATNSYVLPQSTLKIIARVFSLDGPKINDGLFDQSLEYSLL